ncbi:hypothetical protein HY546_00725, partial [archaeon]|nr:hypothetical protein [archaeon]
RVEIKNVTGFVEVEKALTDEIIRQKWLAEDGKKVERETRAWLPEKRSTITLRKKESEEDYGYIFEPDLTMVCIEDEWLEETRKKMPELPHQKLERYIKEFEISREQAASIVADLDFALLFEQVAKQVDAKLAASWMNVLKKTLFYNDLEISQTTLTAGILVKLIGLISAGKLTDHGAEMILRELLADASKFDELVSSYSRSDSMVNSIVKGVLSSNDKAVLDYHAGNVKALQFLIGEVVKKSGRRVDARAALEALKKELG